MKQLKTQSFLFNLLFFFFIQLGYNLQAQSVKTVAEWVAMARSGAKKLSGANFTGANLAGINLSNADLSGSNLTGTNLGSANLTDCKLYNSNLTGVNFTDANLTRADFLATKMQNVNLRNANLKQALLQEADLKYAILNGANLQSANLLLANLEGADLQNANLTNAVIEYIPTSTPSSKTSYENGKPTQNATIIKVENPEIVETEALGVALELYEKDKDAFVKMKGAKINNNTKGIDFVWAKNHGVIVPAAKIK